MYLSQVFSAKNKWLYTLVCGLILGIFYLSYVQGKEVNAKQEMDMMIQKMGQLWTYAITLGSFLIFLMPLFFVVKIFHEKSITQFTTSRKQIDWGRIFFGSFLFGGLLVVYMLIEYMLNPADFVWNFQPMQFFLLFLISLVLLPVQIGFEEYFFRGYFMQWLGLLSRNRGVAFVVSSVLFGLIHISNPEVTKMGYSMLIFYITTGFLLGLVSLMDDGLELSLGIHFANNFTIAMFLTSEHSAFQTPSLLKQVSAPSLHLSDFLILFMIYIIVVMVFAKKYQWKNWKERLFGRVNSYDSQ